MFDQSHGLRFDIYERIHLPAELPGIAELEEVELIPEIQVIQREDRAELYGQLLLTGLYRGENDRTERLEHAIPVEITVPLTRVSSLEDIGVEIENFDIDLLTMRTVNITGVLSLRGVGGAETGKAWQQEEYTVAYSPEQEDRAVAAPAEGREQDGEALYENSLWTYGEGAAEIPADQQEYTSFIPDAAAVNPLVLESSVYTQAAGPAAQPHKEKEAKLRTHSLEDQTGFTGGAAAEAWQKGKAPAEPVSGHFFGTREKEPAVKPAASAADITQAGSGDAAEEIVPAAAQAFDFADIASGQLYAERLEEPVAAVEPENTPAEIQEEAELPEAEDTKEPEAEDTKENDALLSPETLPVQEEKADLKVALGSKKEEASSAKEHLTFSSLLSSSRAHKEQESAVTAAAAPQPEVKEPGNDSDWKSRFISRAGGVELFRKVRMCIVQREDTLDTIAEKYQLSARELVMYNRLAGQNVEEGQVLYIP
ncbi:MULTISPECIES: LysM peptidoglycan-binding domain-containing protein [unclassified Paenibacillus]|uniref:LysM peptidoglycan-binding domain-containing protein n=1 Tax=unclassified Paenibacillus TaxID=185978 RepID=UPI002405E979|nr:MULTISPECIES: LysM peptidoglycan-binding domain-containing protein [unclassified Paenibacillus]MDF9844018.1 stage VI sporulation protein D [Paenibacillus sp. PastF-2]MDF9850623.1 stage VI sporulation protein D [Paenibacillus sp. PastM-2]MDF9857227.1 stage VI sporulation protein D [Paenibacillus sp. PastF-1]MDH6482473.1 stage VI sporulation protein D [Paenibacillus sp. PastH-2]MDH6509924.1 stage VI sporulation protein D [Paenibacillus sp. PastM-3]